MIDVPADSPAHGKLQPGDQLVSLDGQPVGNADALSAVLQNQTPGSTATLAITRAGAPQTVAVTLTKPPEGQKGARIGITVGAGCLAPF